MGPAAIRMRGAIFAASTATAVGETTRQAPIQTAAPMPEDRNTNPSQAGVHEMAVKTLNDLFVHSLSDMYSAEKQLTKALPKLARASTNPDLAAAFTAHLEETQGQVARIDEVVEMLDIKLKRIKCAAMEGLVEEGAEVIDEIEKGPVRDAGLISAAQKAEHYEIASYGTICALGRQLGFDEAVKVLQESLDEEKATDEKLTMLAESEANPDAEAVSDTKKPARKAAGKR
jgi:ferritin-like metal-binding protein YciE